MLEVGELLQSEKLKAIKNRSGNEYLMIILQISSLYIRI